MKKKYIAPLTTEIPVQTMNMIAGTANVDGAFDETLGIGFGGDDDGTQEGDANFYHWDSFDNAPL